MNDGESAMTSENVSVEWASEFANAYVECALWSSTDVVDDEDVSLDDYELSERGDRDLREQASEFIDDRGDVMVAAGLDAGQCGHDFWLSRNGHGAGFWDRGYGALGDELHAATKPYGAVYLYLGEEDQLVYVG